MMVADKHGAIQRRDEDALCKCCCVNAWAQGTLTARSPSSRSGLPSWTASQRSVCPSRKLWDDSVLGKGKLDLRLICECMDAPVGASGFLNGLVSLRISEIPDRDFTKPRTAVSVIPGQLGGGW